MEFRYQNGLVKACQWLSVASHLLFELSIEIALCDDKRANTASTITSSDLEEEIIELKQNPYATELNQLAEKLRDKLEIIMVINDLDPFEIESWHMLDIFDEEPPEHKRKWEYHDLVRFCYKQISFFPVQMLTVITPGMQMLHSQPHNSGHYPKPDAVYEKSVALLLDAIEDFDSAIQGFIIARYFAKIEGRIV